MNANVVNALKIARDVAVEEKLPAMVFLLDSVLSAETKFDKGEKMVEALIAGQSNPLIALVGVSGIEATRKSIEDGTIDAVLIGNESNEMVN